MLKWTGALAAGAVIGGAAVYGATYKAPPPPPPSFKPPLGADVQKTVDGIVQGLVDRHAGESVMFGGCSCNCAGTGCVFEYRVKNGVLTAVGPDQGHHPNMGMEDQVMTQQEFDWGEINKRGCPIGYGWVDHLYSPDRVLYPIARAPGTARGAGQWVRVSWTDAINTISTNMKQLKDKYGPFFLLNPYGSTTGGADTVFSIYGAGSMGYGLCSDDVGRITGPFSGLTGFSFSVSPGNDIPDALRYSKVMILLGMSHFTTHYGGSGWESGWYRRLAREKGTPIIQIDPKYTWDAEVGADQWIPIKPGTDCSLLFAMSYVILTENLYDPTYWPQWMRAIDFQAQADYILGKGGKGVPFPDQNLPGYQVTGFAPDYTNYDTIPKTPEWAETITGIPAATIRELARLYGKTKPGILMRHYGVTRKSYGEYTLKMALWLAIITGNAPGVHGGFGSNGTSNKTGGVSLGTLPRASAALSGASTQVYTSPTFYRAYHWWKAVSYGVRVLNNGPSVLKGPGKVMDWTEWAQIVGFNAAPAFLTMFNPRMLWGNASNQVTMGENSNAQIRAMTDPAIQFSFHQHSRITTTGKYTDMILPLQDNTFENSQWASSGYGGFDGQHFLIDIGKKPGEAKTSDQICMYILNGLGGLDLAHQYWSGYNGDATYDADMAAQKSKLWDSNGKAWLAAHGVSNPPTWDQVVKADKGHGLTSFHPSEFWTTGPSSTTFNGYDITGKLYTIDTKSGKYEHYWDALADNSTRGKEHFDFKGRKYAHVANDWKDLQPISVYHPSFNGMEDYPKLTGNGLPRLKTYPLMILTTNTRVRIHYLMGDPGNPRTRDTIRHSLIISTADAK
jgi:anaerobic selenocysteine-containing dehydrogenase